jgi:hypothetical protein
MKIEREVGRGVSRLYSQDSVFIRNDSILFP